VPALLAPFAIFVGWTWVRRRGGRALEMALFVVGLHFGVGVISLLDAAIFPSSPDVTIADALPGLLLSGALFVLPAALLAAGAYWLLSRANGIALAVGLFVCVAVAAFLAGLLGAGAFASAGAWLGAGAGNGRPAGRKSPPGRYGGRSGFGGGGPPAIARACGDMSPRTWSAVYGSIAIRRALLSAVVSMRWCFAQVPLLRRGSILPRSLMNRRIRPTSL